MKKVLVILGHPRTESYNGALASAYADSVRQAGADVKQLENPTQAAHINSTYTTYFRRST